MPQLTPRLKIVIVALVVSIVAGAGIGLLTAQHKKPKPIAPDSCLNFYDRTGTKILFTQCGTKKILPAK